MVGLWYVANRCMVANESRNENVVIESIIRTSLNYRCHSRQTGFLIFSLIQWVPRIQIQYAGHIQLSKIVERANIISKLIRVLAVLTFHSNSNGHYRIWTMRNSLE
jgi:hypothetical protein